MTQRLPVLDVIDQIRSALADPGSCVLVAPPGTGKTTGVPPALLDEPWLGDNRIVMLEPRRLAARLGATRMADTHGERVGDRFGYSVRGESRTSRNTRVEVVTEGLFLRRVQNDPEMHGIGAVILDEFHERSVDSDLALALLLDLRSALRPDLRIVVMSATIEPGPVASLLDAPTVVATTTIHPVETRYRPGSAHVPLQVRVSEVVLEALADEDGDILVFLPGRPEISRTRRELERRISSELRIVELHGSLPPDEQHKAIATEPSGLRRIILSTSLAETSITVPGVKVVIDSGRRRTSVVDPHTGLPRLATTAVSRAGADQRRGRAGRIAPGVAYRLWGSEEHRHRPESDPPEILSADLAPLLLQLYAWGASSPTELRWLDAPPESAIRQARDLLDQLGAIDRSGRLSPRGHEFATIGFHPRLAAMATVGLRLGRPDLAAEICALVETGRPGALDLMERLDSLGWGAKGRSEGLGGDIDYSLRQWRSTLRSLPTPQGTGSDLGTDGPSPSLDTEDAVAQILMAGFPDRVARRRSNRRTTSDGRSHISFQLRNGGEVYVPPDHPFERCEWLVVTDLDFESQRLHLGLGVSDAQVMGAFESEIIDEDVVEWNDSRGKVDALRRSFLGSIKVRETPIDRPSADAIRAGWEQAFTQRGLALFGRLDEAAAFRSRIALVRNATATADAGSVRPGALEPTSTPPGSPQLGSPQWPDFSDEGLLQNLFTWIGDRTRRLTTIEAFERFDLLGVLKEQLSWDQMRLLDELAPTKWKLESGRSVSLRYGDVDGDPSTVLASVRLRDAFGTDSHPTVLNGAVPVTVELLSPAGRPVQRTTFLPGFWRGSYRDVRTDLRGRYPKHPWPEEPWLPAT